MRLNTQQVQAIRHAAHQFLGERSRVRLFGSRVNDKLRGGDIDLYFETDDVLPNRARTVCQLGGALTLALGDRKIDIILKDANTPDAPIFAIAKDTGVAL